MKKKNIALGILFVLFIATIIILCNYIKSERLSNILLTIFSALLGGTITLYGVVLTIWHSNKNFEVAERSREIERKDEEKKKAKPYFTFQLVQKVNCNLNDKKVCFENCSEFMHNNAAAIIENSNQSVFVIKQIYHDGKWYDIIVNNVILQDSKVFFSFRFNSYFNIFIKVSDILNNLYYYEIKVMPTIRSMGNTLSEYTFSQLSEITEDELNKKIANEN